VDTVESLIVDLLEWVGPDGRPYAEVQEAWRTSCPRLPVWEDAVDAGYLERRLKPGGVLLVHVTTQGAEHLSAARSGGKADRVSGAARTGS
jgi:hypothetical protein